MAERDGYIEGVPCWIDTSQPDPDAAATFYAGLFGWELEDLLPPGSGATYLVGRIRGGDVAAIGSQSDGAEAPPSWRTYIWVDDADATARKVIEAGGAVVTEPYDVFDAGRTATCADPEGAVFHLWQANRHRGARIVNEAGALTFNGLHTRDLEVASAFYGSVFGWDTFDLPAGKAWTLAAYGDYLEELTPGTRARTAEYGVPGFENVVAAINLIADDERDTQPHWSVTFSTDDADGCAEQAASLGGEIVVPPFDAPFVRMTVIRDPQGASFTASQFVPENRGEAPPTPGAST
jgi:predicted enzyme related to lactoylglutathione lyase